MRLPSTTVLKVLSDLQPTSGFVIRQNLMTRYVAVGIYKSHLLTDAAVVQLLPSRVCKSSSGKVYGANFIYSDGV